MLAVGGGAVLMALAMSLKYDKVVGNDLNSATIKLFDAVLIHKGQIEYEHPEPCSRNDFYLSLQKIENGNFSVQDCVYKFCGSFGNSGKNYLYGNEIEEYKILAEKMLTARTLAERRRYFGKFVKLCRSGGLVDDVQQLKRLQELEGLERLERLERLDCKSLFDIDYSEFDIVYFDIPYKETAKYDFEFDYERFYDLFSSLKIPAFVSEYDAPFECVSEFKKTQLLGINSKSTTKEKLFFNGTKERYKELMGVNYNQKAEQCCLL